MSVNSTWIVRIARLFLASTASDHLVKINFQALQAKKPKPEGVDPKTYYVGLQAEAQKGPVFNRGTIQTVDALTHLSKDYAVWLGTQLQAKGARLADPASLVDWLMATRPDTKTLALTQAVRESAQWHRAQHTTPAQGAPTAKFTTHDVVMAFPDG